VFAAAVPPPTVVAGHRAATSDHPYLPSEKMKKGGERRERTESLRREERERFWEMRERWVSPPLYIPSWPDPVWARPRPNARLLTPKPNFVFFLFSAPPIYCLHPFAYIRIFFLVLLATCLFICLFTHLYSYYIFFRCILCLVRICIFILLLKHP